MKLFAVALIKVTYILTIEFVLTFMIIRFQYSFQYGILRKGLDTVESLSVEVKGSKVANFTVLVTLLPTLVTYFCHF